jgi:hypothetical protein
MFWPYFSFDKTDRRSSVISITIVYKLDNRRAHCSVVGDNLLEAGRTRIRVPLRSLNFRQFT